MKSSLFLTTLLLLFSLFLFFSSATSKLPPSSTSSANTLHHLLRYCDSFTKTNPRSLCTELHKIHQRLIETIPRSQDFDPRFGAEKRLVPSGPNPLHNWLFIPSFIYLSFCSTTCMNNQVKTVCSFTVHNYHLSWQPLWLSTHKFILQHTCTPHMARRFNTYISMARGTMACRKIPSLAASFKLQSWLQLCSLILLDFMKEYHRWENNGRLHLKIFEVAVKIVVLVYTLVWRGWLLNHHRRIFKCDSVGGSTLVLLWDNTKIVYCILLLKLLFFSFYFFFPFDHFHGCFWFGGVVIKE